MCGAMGFGLGCKCRGERQNVEGLRNIYAKVESSVLLGNSRTEWVEIEVGLRQGCLLSPLLFDIFLDSSARDKQSGAGSSVWEQEGINSTVCG